LNLRKRKKKKGGDAAQARGAIGTLEKGGGAHLQKKKEVTMSFQGRIKKCWFLARWKEKDGFPVHTKKGGRKKSFEPRKQKAASH